jgi:hypothetical protein
MTERIQSVASRMDEYVGVATGQMSGDAEVLLVYLKWVKHGHVLGPPCRLNATQICVPIWLAHATAGNSNTKRRSKHSKHKANKALNPKLPKTPDAKPQRPKAIVSILCRLQCAPPTVPTHRQRRAKAPDRQLPKTPIQHPTQPFKTRSHKSECAN